MLYARSLNLLDLLGLMLLEACLKRLFQEEIFLTIFLSDVIHKQREMTLVRWKCLIVGKPKILDIKSLSIHQRDRNEEIKKDLHIIINKSKSYLNKILPKSLELDINMFIFSSCVVIQPPEYG